MDEAVKEQLTYQLDSIMYKLWDMVKSTERLMIRLDDDSKEWPEEADIMLEELDNAAGDLEDIWYTIVPEIARY